MSSRRRSGSSFGIDLGTTFSSMAYVDFPPDRNSERLHFEPASIRLLHERLDPGTELQGSDAAYLLPTLVDYGASPPQVGRRVSEEEGFVVHDFKLDLGSGNPPYRLPSGQTKRSEEAAIDVLRSLRCCAEDFFGGLPIDRVCLAMPSTDYGAYQIERTDLMARLGREAGFSVINVIEEPLAAILDIDFTTGGILTHEDRIVMVIDYGGGTCNVAVVRASYRRFYWSSPPRPLALAVERCGGRCIDSEIADWIKRHHPEVARMFSERGLKEVSRELKEKMSRYLQGEDITDPSSVAGQEFGLREETFKSLSRPIVERILVAVERALEQAREGQRGTLAVDLVFLVGGGSQHPLVEEIIGGYFAEKKVWGNPIIERAEFPQLSISRGAALYEYYCSVGQLPMADALHQELYLEFPGGSMKRLARRGQMVPFRRPNRFEVAVADPLCEVQLKLWKRDPISGAMQVYATPVLSFSEQVVDTKLRLDIAVDLRQHVIIKAYTRKRSRKQERQSSTEVIVRSPLG